jgi:2-polyprenyl-3-methyl-5-hydroxy-6-metoxy-1,4-benzoquinol methylase
MSAQAITAEVLPGFKFDPETGVCIPAARSLEVKYRDGAETYVSEVVSKARDIACGSEELSLAIRDFASRYHLSSERTNLLRPVQKYLRGRILEIGAGCGAITRFLGECGAHVLALESSAERAAICRSRTRDLSNVTVAAGELGDIAEVPQFDVVIVVGVLEYSRMFMGGEDGPASFLAACRKLLKPGGTLILAIENQFGLKYLAGAPEDHLDSPYAGIEGRYGSHSPVTFGRAELEECISHAGLGKPHFLFPFPDYKFPNVVISDAALTCKPETAASILRFTVGHAAAEYYPSFSEEMAWPVVVRNRLTRELANSFLVVAGADSADVDEPTVHVYTTSRRRGFAKAATIDLRDGGSVSRTPIYPQEHLTERDKGAICQRIEDETLFEGPTIAEELCAVVNEPGWSAQQLAGAAEPWVEYLRSRAMGGGEDPLILGDYFDCIPVNLIRDQHSNLQRFDQEWVARDPVPISRIIARGLFDFLARLRSVTPRGDSDSELVVDAVIACAGYLGATAEAVEFALEQEAQFQAYVTGEARSPGLYVQTKFRTIRRASLIRNFGASLSSAEAGSEGALANALFIERERANRLSRELQILKSSRAIRAASVLAACWRRFIPRIA